MSDIGYHASMARLDDLLRDAAAQRLGEEVKRAPAASTLFTPNAKHRSRWPAGSRPRA
jgi:hypothetical protein